MTWSFQNLVLGVALALMIGLVLYLGRGLIVPVVVAALIVYVIIGIAGLLRQMPLVGRQLPDWALHLLAILGIAVAVLAIAVLIATNLNQVIAVTPQYEQRVLGLIQKLAVVLAVETEPTWTTLRDDVIGQIHVGSLIGTTVSSASRVIGVAALVIVYASFLLVERHSIRAKVDSLAEDPETVAGLHAILAQINARIGQYLALKTLVNVLLGVLSWIMMTLVGVEFAAFWAAMIGLLNYIPYVGSFLGVLFPVALSVLQFADLGTVLLVLTVLTAAQMFVGNVVEPYLLGNTLNLSPMVILFNLGVWTSIWGIPGAILSVPITASILIVFASFPATRPIAVLLSQHGQVGEPAIRRADADAPQAAATPPD